MTSRPGLYAPPLSIRRCSGQTSGTQFAWSSLQAVHTDAAVMAPLRCLCPWPARCVIIEFEADTAAKLAVQRILLSCTGQCCPLAASAEAAPAAAGGGGSGSCGPLQSGEHSSPWRCSTSFLSQPCSPSYRQAAQGLLSPGLCLSPRHLDLLSMQPSFRLHERGPLCQHRAQQHVACCNPGLQAYPLRSENGHAGISPRVWCLCTGP